MNRPYTYLLKWTAQNKYYYGVRWAKNCHPNELWKTYFTSSGHVKEFVELVGDPDVIQVRKVFKNSKQAQLWEHKFLCKVDVRNNDIFLNKATFKNFIAFNCSGRYWFTNGKISVLKESCPPGFRRGRHDLWKNSKTKNKMRKKLSSYRWFNDGKKNYRKETCPEGCVPGRLTFKRTPPTKETREKMSKSAIGRKMSEETKNKISKTSSKNRWWNNGHEQTFSPTCPEGWWSGRLKWK